MRRPAKRGVVSTAVVGGAPGERGLRVHGPQPAFARFVGATLALMVLGATACSGAVGTPSSSPGADNGSGASSPGTGSSGSGTSNGGANNGGASGPSAPPVTQSDAGAGGSAAPPPTGSIPVSPCGMTIDPIAPPRLFNLLAGPGERLRVHATIPANQTLAAPTWVWQVVTKGGTNVPTAAMPGDPSTVEFSIAAADDYQIHAQASDSCYATIYAQAVEPQARTTVFWVRLTPPRSSNLPAQDDFLSLGSSGARAKAFTLNRFPAVAIDPQQAPPGLPSVSLPSFIQITSPRSSVRFEGHNGDSAFSAALNPVLSYDVLVVPDGPVAPALIHNVMPTMISDRTFLLDDGTLVTGAIKTAAGAAMTGARVLLRADGLPSTVGTSDTGGQFQLRARPAGFAAVVLPPPDSGLPEAHLPQTIALSASPLALDFTWKDLQSGRVDVTVTTAAGQPPTQPVRVRLEASDANLPDVGTFTVAGAPTTASGFLRVEQMTGAGGVASFARLPQTTYTVLLTPSAADAQAALTTTTLDTTTPGAKTLTLARPVTVHGRLAPVELAAGLQLTVTDGDGASSGDPITQTIAADGSYSLTLAPNHTYRLETESARDRALPRLFLGPVTTMTSDLTLPDVELSASVPFIGSVTLEQMREPGVVVQIFCTGLPPDCVDPTAPQTDNARPVTETVTGSDGTFQVALPDPATWSR